MRLASQFNNLFIYLLLIAGAVTGALGEWIVSGVNRVVLMAIGICLFFQLLFTCMPAMNTLFGTEPLDLDAWARCIAIGVAIFVLVEIEKAVRRRWFHTNAFATGGLARREHER